jgi:hypothetical protein
MRLSAFFNPGVTRHEVDDILHVDNPLTDLIAIHEGSPPTAGSHYCRTGHDREDH